MKLNGCAACHDPHESDEPALLLQPPDAICKQCHEVEKVAPFNNKHGPVEDGRCYKCHSPHSSQAGHLLKTEGNDLCLYCHGNESLANVFMTDLTYWLVHDPVKDSPCETCHAPHSSDFEKLLVTKVPDLCYKCHDRRDTAPYVHGAVLLGKCNACHPPHSSGKLRLLRFQDAQMCYECHSDDVTGRAVVHKPVSKGDCLSCHDPHQSGYRGVLKKKEIDLCFDCHSEIKGREFPHKIKGKTGCTSCHDPHGGANEFMLQKPIIEVCGGCHRKQRDGHHVSTAGAGKPHPVSGVEDPLRKGKELQCTSCHDPHGSDNEKLFRRVKTKELLCKLCHKQF